MEKGKLTPKELKVAAQRKLQEKIPPLREKLAFIDERLLSYIESVATQPKWHNTYEILGAVKFLRILANYDFNVDFVQKVFRMFEGRWENHRYVENSGGLKFPGLQGLKHYELQPFQVFILAWTYGPMHEVDTGSTIERRLPNEEIGERVDENGHIIDYRRLVTQVINYFARKGAKTMLAGFVGFVDFMMGDSNSEIYCMANSLEQAKRVFKELKNDVHQLDPKEQFIRFTATEINWKQGQPRSSLSKVLSAGGKTKDGPMASTNLIDEYGSAMYVKGHSDMANLVEVMKSSMGPRRNPLNFITTTAGNILDGPFINILAAQKEELVEELDEALPAKMEGDFQACLLLEPDEWLRDEETLFSNPDVWRMVNPMIGISVQNDFYEKQIAASRRDPETKRETINKLFNVYSSESVQEWQKAETIRELQTDLRIDDLNSRDGWKVFTGFDFSLGDDLHACSYLAVNVETGEMFGDCDAWISQIALQQTPIRPLYEKWIAAGYLHVVDTPTFQPSVFLDRIDKLADNLDLMLFGYDPYKAITPINDLKAWVAAMGGDPNTCVIPVRQNFATYNPLVGEMNALIKNKAIRLSSNQLWPWEFGNCYLAESNDGMGNLKPVKRDANSKVDNVQCLLTALHLFDLADNRKQG